jgi:hypothetical protein
MTSSNSVLLQMEDNATAAKLVANNTVRTLEVTHTAKKHVTSSSKPVRNARVYGVFNVLLVLIDIPSVIGLKKSE